MGSHKILGLHVRDIILLKAGLFLAMVASVVVPPHWQPHAMLMINGIWLFKF